MGVASELFVDQQNLSMVFIFSPHFPFFGIFFFFVFFFFGLFVTLSHWPRVASYTGASAELQSEYVKPGRCRGGNQHFQQRQ